jgi:hypothetical protein
MFRQPAEKAAAVTTAAVDTLRQYLLGVTVAICMALGACASTQLYARLDKTDTKVDALHKTINESTVTDAVIQKDIEEFHKSSDKAFELLERLIREDLAKHH